MTFRRALAALALCCSLVAPAEARILVVQTLDTHGVGLTQDVYEPYIRQQRRQDQAIIELLNMFGVDYRLMPMTALNTEMLRTGLVYYKKERATSAWAFDTNGPSEQFDGVIVLGGGALPSGYSGGERDNPPWPRDFNACYPCSLTVGGVTKAPLKPVLFLFGSDIGQNFTGNNGAMQLDGGGGVASRCTTGVSDFSQNAFPRIIRSTTGTGSFISTANVGSYIPNATPPTGGFRAWLKTTPHATQSVYIWTGIETENADSVIVGSGADSLVMWERPFTGLYAGANNTNPIKPIIWANVMGASPCNDSASTGPLNRPCEYDGMVAMAALSRLDSLTSGGVFKKKKQAAIVVVGGFERTLRRLAGGANNADSTVIKATIDSLAALGAPFTLTVNVDSVASYPNELAWWQGKGLRVRYAPVATRAVLDTSGLGSANWSKDRPIDVFGRFRNRAFYGDSASLHTVAGDDSSIYQGLMVLKAKAASYNLLPLSGTVIAPLDDWSPKNMLSKSNALDSLVRVFRLAGYSAAFVDVQRPEADINRIRVGGKDLVRGWYGKQFTYYNRLSGENFRFVGHTGYGINGSAVRSLNLDILGDSTTASDKWTFGGGGPTHAPIHVQSIGRFWAGFVHDSWRDFDWFQSDGVSLMAGYLDVRYPSVDLFNDFNRANVLKVHVSDLGGAPGQPATRPGYWAIKSLKRQFDAINAIAGRTIVSLGFPEDIEP